MHWGNNQRQASVLVLADAALSIILSPRSRCSHGKHYAYDNGRLVMEGDDYYTDDGDDECFTKTMMIITIVVLVVHPSVTD